MNELTVLKEQEVLGKHFVAYGTEERPLFLAKDVAEWIGHSDAAKMVECVDDDEKTQMTNPNNVRIGGQTAWFLTEDGLYEVLMLSRKPIAKEFKKEVKRILRDIRRHGMYAADELLADPDLFIKVLTDYRDEKKRNAKLVAENERMCDTIGKLMHTTKTFTASEIAKELGMRSAKELNQRLYERGVQFKSNGTWLPYSNYADKGYFDIRQGVSESGHTFYDRQFTQKGREFVIRLFTFKEKKE